MTSKIRRTRKDLRNYQRYLSERIVKEEQLFLAVGMGYGKTAAALYAIRQLIDLDEVRCALVIAPLLVAETTWPEELEIWDFARPLTYEVLTGDASRRAFRARTKADVHIINRENVPWLVEFWGDEWPYDMVVIDEFSSFKNPRKTTDPTKTAIKAAEGRARELADPRQEPDYYAKVLKKELSKLKRGRTRFGAMCKARKYIRRIAGLTGTPAPNGLLDLWAQVYLLDQGQRLGADYKSYRDRWFIGDRNGYAYAPREGATSEIMNRLSDIMVSLREDDALELPEVVYNRVEAPLPPKAMDEYRRFARTLVSEEYDVSADTRGILANKLLQFANGSMYREDGDDVPIHDAKLQALEHIVEEAAGAPVLVAYCYKFDLKRIMKRFPKAVLLSEEDITAVKRRWDRGEISMLIGHPASMGHGLNLQYGGHIGVWYGVPWPLEWYLQFNKRLHRSGQRNRTIIHHIVAPGTLDDRVLDALSKKNATQDDVLEAVRIRLENLS